MGIWKTGGEADSLMNTHTTLVTDEQDRARKDLLLNPFKENTRNGIGLIHKLMRGTNSLSRFPVRGCVGTHIRFATPFVHRFRLLFDLNQTMEGTQGQSQAVQHQRSLLLER